MEFEAACIGPAHSAAVERLARAQKRESARFVHDYNDRIFNGLVIASLADILVFRFLVRISLLETVGWVAFAFLQARIRSAAPNKGGTRHVRWSHLALRLSAVHGCFSRHMRESLLLGRRGALTWPVHRISLLQRDVFAQAKGVVGSECDQGNGQ